MIKMAKPTEKCEFDWETFSVFRKDFIHKKTANCQQEILTPNFSTERRHSFPKQNLKHTASYQRRTSEGCMADVIDLHKTRNVEVVDKENKLNQTALDEENFPSFMNSEKLDLANKNMDYNFESINDAHSMKVGDRLYKSTDKSAFVVSLIDDDSNTNTSCIEAEEVFHEDSLLRQIEDYMAPKLYHQEKMFNAWKEEIQSFDNANIAKNDTVLNRSVFNESERRCEYLPSQRDENRSSNHFPKSKLHSGSGSHLHLCKTCTGCRNAHQQHIREKYDIKGSNQQVRVSEREYYKWSTVFTFDPPENVTQNLFSSPISSSSNKQEIRKRSHTFPKQTSSKDQFITQQQKRRDAQLPRQRSQTMSSISALFASLKKRLLRHRTSQCVSEECHSEGKNINLNQSCKVPERMHMTESAEKHLAIDCSLKDDEVLQLFDFTKRSNEIETFQWKKIPEKDVIASEQYTEVAISKQKQTDRETFAACVHSDPQSPLNVPYCGCLPSKPFQLMLKAHFLQHSSNHGCFSTSTNNSLRFPNNGDEKVREIQVPRRRAHSFGEFLSKTAQRVRQGFKTRSKGIQDETKSMLDQQSKDCDGAQPRRRAFTLISNNQRHERSQNLPTGRYLKKGALREANMNKNVELVGYNTSFQDLMNRQKQGEMIQKNHMQESDRATHGKCNEIECSFKSLNDVAVKKTHKIQSKEKESSFSMTDTGNQTQNDMNDFIEIEFPSRGHKMPGGNNLYQCEASGSHESINKQKRSRNIQRKRSTSFLVGPVSFVHQTMRSRSMSVPFANSCKPKRPVLMYRYPGHSGNCRVYVSRYRKYLNSRSKYSCRNKKKSVLDVLVEKANKKPKEK